MYKFYWTPFCLLQFIIFELIKFIIEKKKQYYINEYNIRRHSKVVVKIVTDLTFAYRSSFSLKDIHS